MSSGSEPVHVVWRLANELARAASEHDAGVAVARAACLLSGVECARVWLIDRTRGYRFAGSWPDEDKPPEHPPQDVIRAIIFGAPSTTAADLPTVRGSPFR